MIANYYNSEKNIIDNNLMQTLALKSRKDLAFCLSINDLVSILPYGKTKIYELLNCGKIPAKKIEGKWIIPRDKFLAWFYSSPEEEVF
jgi:hypothetical protein